MKHIFLSLLFLTLCTMGKAQINLREGYVITLAGDTLHGDIDYRTDIINAEQCVFRQNGKNDFQTYKPGEIQGYRFLDNGRYYISKAIHIDNNRTKTVFLEYVVRGQMSLYYWNRRDAKDNTYFLEDENGKMVSFEDVSLLTNRDIRRKNLTEAYSFASRSEKTQKILWEKALTRENVTKAIVTFNDDVCPEGQCEILEYKKRITPKEDHVAQYSLRAGFTLYSLPDNYKKVMANDCYGFPEQSSIPAMYVSTGIEIYMKRLSRGLFCELNADYMHGSETDVLQRDNYIKNQQYFKHGTEEWKLDFHDLTFRLGLGYHWKTWVVQPRISGGMSYSRLWESYVEKSESANYESGGTLNIGAYVGTGVVIPLRHGGITLDYNLGATKYDERKIRRNSIAIGYQF
ncbi:MAG: hypothetical protein J6X31_02970 [Bacteroidales bacterium]|nr:hypothetical protein [Bacteroidales bacterium]